jgi:hypothetical protein
MASPARQIRREARGDLVASWGVEQGLLVEISPEFAAYREIIAPRLSRNPDAYKGCVWIERERSFDELQVDDDETGFVDDLRFGQWIQRRGVNLQRALVASWIAGATDEPEPIDEHTRIQAVALSFLPDERVQWVSLDLDKDTIHAAKVLSVLRLDVGDDALLVHSGSGREGRFRVLMRLQPSCKVNALHELVPRWLARHGFAQGEEFEVFPSQKQGRLPFGRGGCTRYVVDFGACTKEKPSDMMRAFLGLKPINVRALANGTNAATSSAPKRKATSKAPKQSLPRQEIGAQSAERLARRLSGHAAQLEQRHDTPKQNLPRRQVEGRRPPTPRDVRELKKHGISGPGERHKALYEFVRDCRYRVLSVDDAIVETHNWIDAGMINASKDANTPLKREQQKRYAVKLVRHVYETHELPGRPEPIALTPNEAARIKALAERAAQASGYTVNAIRAMLMSILPLFKAGKLAGLPHVRIHKTEWKQAGGSRYREIRDATGIFAATTGYRSEGSLRAKGLSPQGAKEHAYAQSWKTAFSFDV